MQPIPTTTPSFAELGNPALPSGGTPPVDTDMSAIPRAITQAGANIEQSSDQILDQQGKIDAAFAKSNYLTSMITAQKNEENNPDWEGAPQRWKDASKEAFTKAASSISNPMYRAQFEAEAGADTKYQYQAFLQQNDIRRKQDGVGKTVQVLQNNMTAALSAPDDVTASSLINSTNDVLKAAVASGFITPQQEIQERNAWIQQYGKSKIEQMQEAGNAEGAKDWFNRHYDLLNPTLQDTNQVNAAVNLPRAQNTTDRLVNGAPMVNPNVAAAQEQMESGGYQSAVSQKGAVGVMQLMPAAARDAATALGIPYDPEKLKTDEVYNRTLGNEYRNEMIARYAGNQTLALAAYNAGPGKVDQWIKQFGNPNTGEISDADFIAKIPFKETRDYVTAINAKAPPTPGIPNDVSNPDATKQAWLNTAATLPPSISPLVATGVQTRIADGIQTNINNQKQAASTLINPILQGKITDPSQLKGGEMQTAWANANPELQKAVLTGLKAENKDANEMGPKFWDLYKAVHAPDGDPTKITDPTTLYKYGDNNGLTLKGIQQLTSEIDGKKTEEGASKGAMQAQTFKVVKSQVSGEDLFPGMKDPKGESLFAQAMPLVYKAISEGEAKGTPAAELYNPNSPQWVGNAAKGLIRTPDQWHSDIVGANLSDAQPAEKSTGSWWNPFSNTAEVQAKQVALENRFKAGEFSNSDQARAAGLATLRQAVIDKEITADKFKEMAVAYGYARAK